MTRGQLKPARGIMAIARTLAPNPRMPRTLRKSNAHLRKALRRLPLGVASNFRYWGEEHTIYVDRARGARLWAIDGNEYIDYRLGYGPAILGYADPRVDEAARAGMRVGGVFALATEREYAVAERISRMVPAAELVRFSNSGTEAVMAALRLARAYSGRDGYVLMEGGYHGVFDAVLWQADVESWQGSGDPPVVSYGKGVPRLLRQLLHHVPINDAERLEDVLRKHRDAIGALLIERSWGIAAASPRTRSMCATCARSAIATTW